MSALGNFIFLLIWWTTCLRALLGKWEWKRTSLQENLLVPDGTFLSPGFHSTKQLRVHTYFIWYTSTTPQLDANPPQSLQFKVMETKDTQCMQKWWHLTMSWLSWTLELNKVTNLVTYWYKMYVEWEELAGENHGEEMGMNTDWWEKGKSSMLVLFLLWFIDPCH